MGLEDLGGFVFSTDEDFELNEKSDEIKETPPPSKQYLEAHYSSKGRAGKVVTVVSGFVGTDEDLTILGKTLKKKCGVGGSVKDGEIIIQGDVRDKIMAYLTEKKYNVKRVGG